VLLTRENGVWLEVAPHMEDGVLVVFKSSGGDRRQDRYYKYGLQCSERHTLRRHFVHVLRLTSCSRAVNLDD
jgi:hypothetical protein